MTADRHPVRALGRAVLLNGKLPPDELIAELAGDDEGLRDRLTVGLGRALEAYRSGAFDDARAVVDTLDSEIAEDYQPADDEPDDEASDLTDDQAAELVYRRGRGEMVSPASVRKGA